ncbi:MFS transporter [Kitasatospora cineracea]|uniref:hypothetical protein n=1 Tax=Kitasatospora cineracea TaxID=88074 RepID=UPI0036BA44DE
MSLLNRTITRTRMVEFAPHPDAPIELVPEEYTVQVPRDWERAVLAGVAAGTSLLLILAVTWSTASIGALLALSGVLTAIAYGVAACFDLAWIICMALEWLARYDRRKAKPPMIAGFIALAISMAAITTHSIMARGKTGIAVGIVGALVSLIAKGIWTLAIRHTSKPLSPIAQQYVIRRQAAAGAELAMATVERQLTRSRHQLDAYREAYSAPALTAPDDHLADEDEDDNTELILSALHHLPDAPAGAISAQLRRFGRYVPEHEIQQVIDTQPVMSPVASQPQPDYRDDHQDDRRMTTTMAARPVRQTVTSPVDTPRTMTRAQQLAAARRLDQQARRSKPSRPVTIETLQVQLGLSRREATDLRKAVVGKGE